MDKIIQKAFTLAGFTNASVITEVVNATPNPRVATEMLLGIYEPTTVFSFGQHWAHKYRDCILSVVSINELQNQVVVNQYSPLTKRMYYRSEEDYKNDDNGVWEEDRDNRVKYADYRSKTVTGVVTAEKVLSTEDFKEEYKPLTNDQFVDKYNDWAYEKTPELQDNLPF